MVVAEPVVLRPILRQVIKEPMVVLEESEL
jgi:hypothetical protein